MKTNVKWLTRTALMLALLVLFQSLRLFLPPAFKLISIGNFNLSTLIIGSLVNLTLILSVWFVGLSGGLVISVISVIIAFFQGHLPIPQMLPVVAIGNAVIVYVYWLFYRKMQIIGVILGSVAKFLFLWISVSYIIIPLFVAGNAKLSTVLSLGFSWIQLITALIGGFTALAVLKTLKKADMPNT